MFQAGHGAGRRRRARFGAHGAALCLLGCGLSRAVHADLSFVRREGSHLMAGDQRFYFLGASCYYLAYWAADASTNPATGRAYCDLADAYLARCRDLGFNVVRIWAFNDGNRAGALQPAPGVHREEALRGYDYVLDRGARLGLRFVMTLVNNWDDYGGMRWYATNSRPGAAHSDFYTDPQCRAWYRGHVSVMINRTNTLNGCAYRDDPAIFAWQLANEPRWHSSPKDTNAVDTSGQTVRDWIWDMAAFVKSMDANHMVSTGEEGWTSAQSWEGTRWDLNNASPHVDYAVLHCWPDWWTWMWGVEPHLYANAMKWVQDHLDAARQFDKPVVLSEYGKGRPLDGPSGRHAYYQGWFDAVRSSAQADGPAAGLHFWMLESEGSDHDDGFSVFPHEADTLALLSDHARAMNELIAPRVSAAALDRDGRAALTWTRVVGAPWYEVQTSTDLREWSVAARAATNTWSGTAATPHAHYRIRPYWP